jgi:acetyl-CoA C-acetyltransferase
MTSIRGAAAIVGIGEVPTGRYGDRPVAQAAIEAARQAILDSGFSRDEVDVVMPTVTLADRRFNTDLGFSRLVEELGLLRQTRANIQVFAGGASGSVMLVTAAALVATGVARAVLCVHADRLSSGLPTSEAIDLFSTLGIPEAWEGRYGQHYSSIAALVTRRFMHERGVTEEQLASVCVALRKWAELNPNAMFRSPLTIEEVLSSKILSEPLHAKESNVLADGAAGFVVTTAQRARDVCERPVYLIGTGSRVTHYSLSQEADLAAFGWREAGRSAFSMARLSPGDVDIAELYDSYPIFPLIQLEELGFCETGTAGMFVADGNTWPGGLLPMTTNGGMLSAGHTGAGGGFALVVETARQLMGKAGPRQVPGVRVAVETGTGGSYMDAHVNVLSTEVP